jgi:hypothetical protein
MLYPDRRAFFEKLALSLPPQPAIKIGPAPMPSAEHKQGLRVVRKAVLAQEAEHGATKHGVRQMIAQRSKLDKGSRSRAVVPRDQPGLFDKGSASAFRVRSGSVFER